MLKNCWKTKPFKIKSIDKRKSQQERPQAQVKKERPTETALFEEEKAFFFWERNRRFFFQ